VKPDLNSSDRLTVAIGEQKIDTGQDAVVFLAETVAKFDVDDPQAFYAIALDGEPLEPEEYVNRDFMRQLGSPHGSTH
jgi:hypothetical protein